MSGAHNHDRNARNDLESPGRVERGRPPHVDHHKGRSMLLKEGARVVEGVCPADRKAAADQQAAQLRVRGSGDIE